MGSGQWIVYGRQWTGVDLKVKNFFTHVPQTSILRMLIPVLIGRLVKSAKGKVVKYRDRHIEDSNSP